VGRPGGGGGAGVWPGNGGGTLRKVGGCRGGPPRMPSRDDRHSPHSTASPDQSTGRRRGKWQHDEKGGVDRRCSLAGRGPQWNPGRKGRSVCRFASTVHSAISCWAFPAA